MKSFKILASAGFMSIASMAMAQMGDERNEIHFGMKAGVNYANVYDERTDDFRADPKFGFVGGGFLRIPLGKFLGVQPEVLFSQKGFKGEGILLGNSYSFTRTTSYLDFPIQLALKPAEFLTILAGPQYSYLLRQKDVFSNSVFSSTQEEVIKNDNIRKNILGFVVGVDINVQDVVFGARMGWDFQNNNGNGESSAPRYKNVWLQGTLGYTFKN